jgi:hypothetical protein
MSNQLKMFHPFNFLIRLMLKINNPISQNKIK